jgi:uncharacterized membrane protein YebE (DUF533 family)
MGGALGGAALGLLGLVAMKAMSAREGQAGTAAPAPAAAARPTLAPAAPAPSAEADARQEALAVLSLRAMIMAAKADGLIDEHERQAIAGKLEDLGIGEAGRAWLTAEVARPIDVDGFAAEVPDAEAAVMVYAASLLGMHVDTAVETAYLARLADRLGLEPPVMAELHRALGAPPPSPA